MSRFRVLPALAASAFVAFAAGVACTDVPTFSSADPRDAGAADVTIVDGSLPADAGSLDGSADAETGAPTDGGPQKYGIFATAGRYYGNFAQAEPRTVADQFCDTAAKMSPAGYTGTWLALIWTAGGGNPATRIHPSPGGWQQTTGNGNYGNQVLTTLTDNGRTAHEILTQFGGQVLGGNVWTGGSLAVLGDTCSDWAGTGGDEGVLGSTTASSPLWMNVGAKGKCVTATFPIYCIQQPPP